MTEKMNVVITGHVDHGKSTIIGRLMADTGSLPKGKLEKVKKDCERHSKPFEYAFLLDALKDEQSQGITIDSARVFFKTKKRHYIIIDAPGHIEFLKNMVSGAARAESAFLVIDAEEGVQENSRRHGYLLSMLGIRQLCVLVNKMDLVNYDRRVYKTVVRRYTRFLKNLDMQKVSFIPVSGREGDNIVKTSENMPWWTGHTVLTLIDTFQKEEAPDDLPFRMPVQDVYKFTSLGDKRRILVGSITTGTLQEGDEIVFYPSGKRSRVAALEDFPPHPSTKVTSGRAAGFSLTEQIYVKRGDLAARIGEPPPHTGTVFRANLFWLGQQPLTKDKEYFLKLGAERVRMRLFDTLRVINASNLNSDGMKKLVERHEVADCVLTTRRSIAVDLVDVLPRTSRFVIVDGYEIAGGGIIREVIRDNKADYREKVQVRNLNWDVGDVTRELRRKAFGHNPALVLVGGPDGPRKSDFAKGMEKWIFESGCKVYYLGVRNVMAGLDSNLSSRRRRDDPENRVENIHRMAELANLLMDVGIILVAVVSDLSFDEREIFRLSVAPEKMITFWIGGENSYGDTIEADYVIPDPETATDHLPAAVKVLRDRDVCSDKERKNGDLGAHRI